MGTACHIKGGNQILKVWETKLGIKEGEVTDDRLFSLDRVACVGCCAMAPVSVVGEDVHGNMMPTTVDGILLAVEMAERKDKGEG
jgi:NADH-quinone oxidoreductase subunit E